MARKILISILFFALASTASAGKNTPQLAEEGTMDQMDLRAEFRAMAGPTTRAVSEEDVGDADSFGNEKIYLGVNQTEAVFIDTDCTTYGPDDICYELDPVTRSVVVDEFNLGSITLPAKSTESFLCFTFTQFSTWLWSNPTVTNVTADMALRATVQIESEFLDGLSDGDGNPFNGTLYDQPIPIIVATHQNTLPPGTTELQRERVTRSCTGGLVSQRSLRGMGLTDEQAEDFFKDEDMTITFGIQGTARHTDQVIFFHGIRIYGDE